MQAERGELAYYGKVAPYAILLGHEGAAQCMDCGWQVGSADPAESEQEAWLCRACAEAIT
jgi:hypothetical protein